MIFVVVVIHEAGHMVVARVFGVRVPVFSVGMGPRLAGFFWRGTDWRLSALPVGGYVQMAGADAFGEEDADAEGDDDGHFMSKPVWQRLLIMAAGPAVNLIFPFFLFVGVMMLGEPTEDPVVGTVSPGLVAEQAGIRSGDRVLAAGGQAVETWDDLFYTMGQSTQEEVALELERDGERIHAVLSASVLGGVTSDRVGFSRLGMAHHMASSQVGVSDPSSPAARAGIQTWDAIRAVDGQPVMYWHQLETMLKEPVPHEIMVQRLETTSEDGSSALVNHTMTLTPGGAEAHTEEGSGLHGWGLEPSELFIETLVEDSAASKVGLKPGDRLYSIDGQVVRSWNEVTIRVAETVDAMGPDAQPRPLNLVVIRTGETLELEFTPGIRRELVGADVIFRPLMGIGRSNEAFVSGGQTQRYYSFGKAVSRGADIWASVLKATLKMLGNVITGTTTIKESVGGPVAIFQVASQALSINVYYYVNLMAQISFSLGIINLLPVPVFDGGQIVFYSLEGLRGRPLPLELRERIQMVGVLALIGLMLLVTVVDVSRLFDG